jgi:hypothetical protein
MVCVVRQVSLVYRAVFNLPSLTFPRALITALWLIMLPLGETRLSLGRRTMVGAWPLQASLQPHQ